jgi:hypothetical protein
MYLCIPYSCIHVFLIHVLMYYTSPSPSLDPSGLAALQIPRATRRNFAHTLPHPPSTRRDLPRCKSPARPAGTSLNLNLNLTLPRPVGTRHAANPPRDPSGLATLQIPRATRRDFAQP